MTKKAQNLLNTYTEKIEVQIKLYEMEIINYKEFINSLKREEDEFQKLLSGMLHYDMINEKDFLKLFEESTVYRLNKRETVEYR